MLRGGESQNYSAQMNCPKMLLQQTLIFSHICIISSVSLPIISVQNVKISVIANRIEHLKVKTFFCLLLNLADMGTAVFSSKHFLIPWCVLTTW